MRKRHETTTTSDVRVFCNFGIKIKPRYIHEHAVTTVCRQQPKNQCCYQCDDRNIKKKYCKQNLHEQDVEQADDSAPDL